MILRRLVVLLLVAIYTLSTANAEEPEKSANPQFLSFNLAGGTTLPAKVATNDMRSTGYGALSLKYAVASKCEEWQDYAFGKPYWGVGLYLPHFSDYFGHPFSIYFLQGAQLAKLNPKTTLNYEVNLGVSFNWDHYDYQHRPTMLAIGSPVNVHLAGSLYFKWALASRWDLRTGLAFNHFSNGAIRTPNNGVNAVSMFMEVAYRLHPTQHTPLDKWPSIYPHFERRWIHELSFQCSTRTLKLDGVEQQTMHLRDKYPHKNFAVFGINYSPMYWFTRRLMVGPSLEVVYDESADAVMQGIGDPKTQTYKEQVQFGSFGKRFSAGVSLKAELVMPGYAVFANLGYDILTHNDRDERLYQIYGIKMDLCRNLFAAFGVRSTEVSQSKYLFIRVGYSFNKHNKEHKSRKAAL